MSEMVNIELETIECYRREIDASRHLIIRLKSDLQAANNLKSKLAEITELCEAEIESKGRFGANQKILEILEVIQR